MTTDPIEPYPGAWNQTRPANAPAVVNGDGRTGQGAGDSTPDTVETRSGGSALDAAIEAAIAATYHRSWGDFPYDDAEAAVRAAEPILHQALIAERDDLLSKVEAVRALHTRWHLGGTAYICHEDDESWPCNTIQAIGEEADRG